MHLSDETSQKIIHSCKVIQLIIPVLAISSVVFLGIVFSDFVGPITLNERPNRESLFLAGMAFFTATGVAPYFQRIVLASGEQHNTADQHAVSAAKKIQGVVIAACVVLVLAAYANIAAFRTTKDAVNLLVVGFLLVAILSRIPTQTRFRQQIDEFVGKRMGQTSPNT